MENEQGERKRPVRRRKKRGVVRKLFKNRSKQERRRLIRNAAVIGAVALLALVAVVLVVVLSRSGASRDEAADATTEARTEPAAAESAVSVSAGEATTVAEADTAQDASSEASTEEEPAPGASIVYMPNGGTGEPVVVEYRQGIQVPLTNCMFLYDGMLFTGWSRSENGDAGVLQPQETIYIEADAPVTLYAQWAPAAEGALVIDRVDVGDRAGRVDYSNGVRSENGIYRLYIISGGGETIAAEVPAAPSGSIAFAGDNLYGASFVIRALQGGVEVNVCDVQPLFRIEDTDAGLRDQARANIKGILPHPSSVHSGELQALGVRQVIYNLYISHFLDPKSGATVPFEYGGKAYAFNARTVAEYDGLVSTFAANNLTVTMVIVNDTGGYNPLIHQTALGASATLYGLATTTEALETERALGAFLAGRYAHVRNWIIGNEIDAYRIWNYMNVGSIEEYVAEYSRAFRAFYEGIVNANGNARVYISLSQTWMGNFRGQYRGRDIVDLFAATNRDIYWNLAYHPYGWPMLDSTSWDSSYTSMDFDTHTITLENISVLTTYMGMNRMRNPNGSRKSIILSEFGYTSAGGKEADQAASIVYSYRQALRNPHIDAFLLAREMDDYTEMAHGLTSGIRNADGSRKMAWSWYAAMGTAQEQDVVNQAFAYIGQ